ncbi:MAG: PBP1A family penicillin-binding protein [Aggregatilineales bacterium]
MRLKTRFNWFKKRSRLQKALLVLSALAVLFFGFAYVWLLRDLPSIGDLETGLALPSTRIYDRNGTLLYEISEPEQGRNTALTIDQIPQHCINATIATEDANFYSHPGVDIAGITRAVWINVRGGEIIAGGSTITQQVARNLLLDPEQRAERTVRRKLREMILALELQTAYSKDEILELYLNQSYFGNLAYGIDAAARAYFGKSATNLSLSECALLAGLLQNAAAYDPLTNLEASQARQAVVLGLMAQNGYITEQEADVAMNDTLQFAATPYPIEAPHFVMAVWTQLARDYPDALYTDGLDVVTTVDLNWQNIARDIVQRQLDYLNHPALGDRVPANANNAAVVAIDPYTGQILTMLGSPDYFDESIDGAVNATLALRQPGSALKPFTYAAAMNPQLEEPYTASTMILDVATPFVTRRLESYTPANFGLVEHGPVLVREALASSFNIPAVVALEHVGIDRLVDLVTDAGITTLANNTDVDLSITLGGGEVRLLDMAQAYSIFPNGGYRVEPTYILSVTTRDGDVLYEWTPPTLNQRVLDEGISYIISDILSDENARIPSFGQNSALSIGRPAAAKTGTTTDFHDNWVMGYTPNLVVGVWVGNADNTAMVDVTGITGAGPIWNAFLRDVLRGQPEVDFAEPEGLLHTEVCALSGLLPTRACERRRMEVFLPGTVPTQEDTFYQTFEIDRVTGLLADDSTPDDRRVEQVYTVLPPEAQDWAARNGVRQPPPDATTLVSNMDGVRLLSPDPYTIFRISPITPIETQRVRLNAAVPANTQFVTYSLDDVEVARVNSAPWSVWWSLELGTHELVATAHLADGTREMSDLLTFTVTEYEEPASYTVEDDQP